MALRLRRGTDAERQIITPQEGELVYVTDTKELYIGDGTTVGGIRVTGEIADTLDGLTDVDAALPQDGDILVYDSLTSEWESVQLPLVDLPDVDADGIADGQVLSWNSSTQTFVPANNQGGADSFVGDVVGSIFADDSTTLLDAQNRVLNIDDIFVLNTIDTRDIIAQTVTSDLIGDVTGDVIGDVTGDLIGDVTGDVTGDLIGDVVGNLTGNVTGDVVGSVFADDSTTLLDAQNRVLNIDDIFVLNTINTDIIQAQTITSDLIGDVTGDVIGNVTGDVTGDVFGNLTGNVTGDVLGSVFGDDSSLIIDGINNILSIENITTTTIEPTFGRLVVGREEGITDFRLESFQARNRLNINTVDKTGDLSSYTGYYGTLNFGFEDATTDRSDATIRGAASDMRMAHDTVTTFISDESKYFTLKEGNFGFGTYTPTAKLDVRGDAVFSGDITASAFKGTLAIDDSSIIIDGTTGSLIVANIDLVGETGNTPVDTGTVDSWLQVTVNGATKYIPLYD